MADKRVTGKRLRMRLDFEVEVEELTDEEILWPLLSRLGEEDERFYREVSDDDVLAENTAPLERSFRCRRVGAMLEEVKVVGEGQPGRPSRMS